jgi:transcriptional regulator of arginine metabolism
MQGTVRAAKLARQQLIRELVAERPIASQQELAAQLGDRGISVTQATISRDIAALGLIKVKRGSSVAYASRSGLGGNARGLDDERLRRILADYPVRIGRSGLTLLVLSGAGTAAAIAQAIDDSTLHEQEGTLAGDDTILVLFADEDRLDAWLRRFETLLPMGR